MPVLVSFCNLRAPALPALGLLDIASLSLRVLPLPRVLPEIKGITGLAANDRFVFAGVQALRNADGTFTRESSLLVFDRGDFSLVNHHLFRSVVEVHSLWLEGGTLFCVSTGTDEIVAAELDGARILSERTHWRPEPDAPREDSHHLNSLIMFQGELHVTGFGGKSAAGTTAASWKTANDGFVLNIANGEKMAEGIDQPHSLVAIGGSLLVCESQRSQVRPLRAANGFELPGYTRGLCVAHGKLLAATSVGRRVSNSTGAVSNPGHETESAGIASISRISPGDYRIEATADLCHLGYEIYDLLAIEGCDAWPVVPETEWRDAALRSLADALDTMRVAVAAHRRERLAFGKTIAEQNASLQRADDEAAVRDGKLGKLEADIENFATECAGVQSQTAGHGEQLAALGAHNKQTMAIQAETLALAREMRDLLVYERLVRDIKRTVEATLPPGATVLVASRGDDELIAFAGRKAWHFPREDDGTYAGCNPGDGKEAIAQLKALRKKGAEFLVVPATMLWWLDYYDGLNTWLRDEGKAVLEAPDICVIFALPGSKRKTPATA